MADPAYQDWINENYDPRDEPAGTCTDCGRDLCAGDAFVVQGRHGERLRCVGHLFPDDLTRWLHKLANEDFRGNRPQASADAERFIRRYLTFPEPANTTPEDGGEDA